MNKKTKNNILTNTYLYLFMLIIPILVISIVDITIKTTPVVIATIAFIYSILCFLLCIFNYKKLKTLDKSIFYKRISTFKKGLLVVFLYFFTSICEPIPLLLLTNNIANLPLIIKVLYLAIFEVFQVALIIYIFKDDIIKNIKDIKKNHKKYFSKCVNYYLLAIIIMMISNVIISLINSGNIAGNEQNVRDMFNKAPIYMYFSAVIIAPIIEELTFRKGIRSIFSNDKLFIIVSGLVFGGLHVIGNINSLVDILYLIPYSIPGLAFAYMLYKTDNILVPMGFHFLHNGVTMSLQIIFMIFGLV